MLISTYFFAHTGWTWGTNLKQILVASAMWPWFNSNPLMSMQDNSKKQLSASEAGDDLIHGDEAEKLSKSEKPNNGSGKGECLICFHNIT